MKNKNYNRGVTLYIALAVSGAILLVGLAIADIAARELVLSTVARDSQVAFFAADSGTECAIYWDIKNPTNPGRSAFATSSPIQNINCYNSTLTPTRVINGTTGVGTSTVSITSPYCMVITVVKSYNGVNPATKIESRGYNTCNVSNLRRVERAIRVSY